MKESTISAIGNGPLVLDKNSRDKKFKEEWVDEHINTGLNKEVRMEPPSNQIYHTKLVLRKD